jgi:acetyl esterase/lipase
MMMETYHIWDGQQKPFDKSNSVVEYEQECWGTRCVFCVTEPTLTVYPAQGENTAAGIVVLPGGGYTAEAIQPEGHDVARALAWRGVTAAVLKYRLPNPETSDQPEKVPLADTRRAVQLLRQVTGLNRVGVIGFSAGSHLAAVASLWKSSDPTENPSFSGLMYGTTNLSPDNMRWLEDSLYFRRLNAEEQAKNRLLDLVTESTPPAFLVHACDDEVCRVEESTLYAEKLRQQGVPFEMHIFPKGGHGFGLGREEDGTDQWLELFVNWLRRLPSQSYLNS